MKINKKILGSLIIGGLLFTSGGIVVADDTITRDFGIRQQARQAQNLDNPACFTAVDQLVTEKNLTQEEANSIKQKIEEKRNQHFAARDIAREERRNSGERGNRARLMQNPEIISKLVEDGTLTPEQAKLISERAGCRR